MGLINVSCTLSKKSFQHNMKFAQITDMASTPHFTDFSKSNNSKIKSVTQKNQSAIKTTNQSRSKKGKLSLLKPKNYYEGEKSQNFSIALGCS